MVRFDAVEMKHLIASRGFFFLTHACQKLPTEELQLFAFIIIRVSNGFVIPLLRNVDRKIRGIDDSNRFIDD